MGKGLEAFLRSSGIEDYLNQAQECVIFDDEFERHKGFVQQFNDIRTLNL